MITPPVLATFGTFNNDEHTLKAGLNYRFNLGSTSARYLATPISRKYRIAETHY